MSSVRSRPCASGFNPSPSWSTSDAGISGADDRTFGARSRHIAQRPRGACFSSKRCRRVRSLTYLSFRARGRDSRQRVVRIQGGESDYGSSRFSSLGGLVGGDFDKADRTHWQTTAPAERPGRVGRGFVRQWKAGRADVHNRPNVIWSETANRTMTGPYGPLFQLPHSGT
jgi:hypothetical protein